MSILAALVRAYDTLDDVPAPGYSSEKVSFVIGLDEDGTPVSCSDIRQEKGKKKIPILLSVPQPPKRTAGIKPNFLWDKSSYVLGVTAGEGKRTADEHAAFVQYHEEMLSGSNDEGLRALLRFLRSWQPSDLEGLDWSEDIKDQNIIFALEKERLSGQYIHQRKAAKRLIQEQQAAADGERSVCLVLGETAAIARLHPSIKGVWGAQSSGASIVSFNQRSFESYGHDQGVNAQVSEQAAFAYTTSLNYFLQSDSGHRIQIGDASTVFWAEAEDTAAARDAEALFNELFNEQASSQTDSAGKKKAISQTELKGEVKKIHHWLDQLRQGKPLKDIAPQLAQGVRFYVLGLAPNASRLSIRYWWENDFGVMASNYQRYVQELKIEPPARDPYPPMWKYLSELAVLGKRENVPPNLAGNWMRAILNGSAYPLTLLSTLLMRLRADKEINALRASLLKAVLIRNFEMEVPVALDVDCQDKGYLLGRLFALYEQVQYAALKNVNASIKDKYYGAASAQPRKVFALLEKNSAHHLSKVGKENRGRRVNLEKEIAALMAQMDPNQDPFPSALSAQQQALFGLGYYHQRAEQFKTKEEHDSE